MDGINKELELYKLVTANGSECGCVSDDKFFIWLDFFELSDFVKKIKEVFGRYVFDEGGVDIVLQESRFCIDLTNMIDGSDVDFERVFPRDDFKH